MMSPQDFARDFIFVWEDGSSTDPNRTHSLDRDDRGNTDALGRLIGSNHGITANALAVYRNVPLVTITREVMRALTITEAAAIALSDYYRKPGMARLTWNAVTASVMDFGYTAGTKRAVIELQRMISVDDDGVIGNDTSRGFSDWLAKRSIEDAAGTWCDFRNMYYDDAIKSKPSNVKYRNGWRNRSEYYLPDHPRKWWSRFNAAA